VDQALEAWGSNEEAYRPELARTMFLRAKILWLLCDDDNAVNVFNDAVRRRKILVPPPWKPDEELSEEDFDDLVTFWSK
jgi:hypothetical protein